MIRLVSMALTIACFACAPANKESATPTDTTVTTATSSADTSAPPADTTEPATTAKENRPMTDYKDKVAELHTSAGEIDIRFIKARPGGNEPGHHVRFVVAGVYRLH